jgi:multidrug resistance efflux pump
MKRFAVIPVLLVAAGCVGLWLWLDRSPADEILLGGYFEAEQIQVGSKLGGRVAEVFVEEGSDVQAGQALVVFETDEVEAQLAEARADLDQANAKLAELKAGTRPEEIQQAVARVGKLKERLTMFERGPRPQEIEQARLMNERSKAEYENALATYERQLALAERNATARETLDAARKTMETTLRTMEADRQRYELLKEGYRTEEIAMAGHELEEAEAALELARKGPRAEEIEQAQAAVEAAQARIRRLEVQLKEGTVTAPLPCIVEAFDLEPGDLIVPGAPLATLVRKDQLWVRAFIAETDLGFVHENQRVTILVDSFPARRFDGSVLRVNRLGEFTPRNVQTFKERQDMVFGIKVRVEDPQGELRPGMAATVQVPRKS